MPRRPSLARDPLYLQACQLLTRRIADGTWKPGAILPNESDLARELSVSAGTIRKALDKLEADGLVRRRQGKGTFVVDQAAAEVASRFDRLRQKDGGRIARRAELLRRDVGLATELEQQQLQIGADERVLRTRHLRNRQSVPFLLEDACVAVSRFPGWQPDEVDDCSISALAQKHGVLLGRARERVELEVATPEIAGFLLIEPGTVLMKLDRVILAMNGQPIEWRIGLCRMKDECYLAEMS